MYKLIPLFLKSKNYTWRYCQNNNLYLHLYGCLYYFTNLYIYYVCLYIFNHEILSTIFGIMFFICVFSTVLLNCIIKIYNYRYLGVIKHFYTYYYHTILLLQTIQDIQSWITTTRSVVGFLSCTTILHATNLINIRVTVTNTLEYRWALLYIIIRPTLYSITLNNPAKPTPRNMQNPRLRLMKLNEQHNISWKKKPDYGITIAIKNMIVYIIIQWEKFSQKQVNRLPFLIVRFYCKFSDRNHHN